MTRPSPITTGPSGFIPPVIQAFGARGTTKLAQGKPAAALADFDAAIKANPKDATNYDNRGNVLKAQGKLEAAEASYREALHLSPDDPLVLNLIGYFLVEQNKNLTEALQLIQRAVNAQPTNASFLHSLGWAHFKLDHLDEAERYLSESVRRDERLPSRTSIWATFTPGVVKRDRRATHGRKRYHSQSKRNLRPG